MHWHSDFRKIKRSTRVICLLQCHPSTDFSAENTSWNKTYLRVIHLGIEDKSPIFMKTEKSQEKQWKETNSNHCLSLLHQYYISFKTWRFIKAIQKKSRGSVFFCFSFFFRQATSLNNSLYIVFQLPVSCCNRITTHGTKKLNIIVKNGWIHICRDLQAHHLNV